MKAEKVRDMSDDELERKYEELTDQLFRMRIQKATAQLDRPQKIREVKKDLARVKTVLSERRRAESHQSWNRDRKQDGQDRRCGGRAISAPSAVQALVQEDFDVLGARRDKSLRGRGSSSYHREPTVVETKALASRRHRDIAAQEQKARGG